MRNVFTSTELSTYAHRDRRDAVFFCPVTLNTCFKRVCSYGVLYMYEFDHKPILNIPAVSIMGRISITVDVKNTLVIDICYGSEPRDFPLPLKNQ